MKKGNILRKRGLVIAACAMLMLNLTACGSTNESYQETQTESTTAYDSGDAMYDEAAMGEPMEAPVSEEAYKAAPEAEASLPAEDTTQASNTGRKLIKNVNMSVETQEFDTVVFSVKEKVVLLGGYVESMNIGENGYSETDITRYASITARIPSNNLDQFVNNIETITNMINKSETVQDVTLQYVDVESHKKMLVTEQDSLLRLLEKAETIEDIITIESRLSEVRYQIESMESQLRTFDNQIDYSTVYLNITEVERLTPAEEKNAIDRITVGFWENVYHVQDGVKEFAIWFVINIPYLVLYLVLALIIIIIVKIIIRSERKKAAKNKKVTKEETKSYAQLYTTTNQEKEVNKEDTSIKENGSNTGNE